MRLASLCATSILVLVVATACEGRRDEPVKPKPVTEPEPESDTRAESAGAEDPKPEPETPEPTPLPTAPLPPYALAWLNAPGVEMGPVSDLAWSADGSVIATASRDGAVRLWNAREHTLERTLPSAPVEGAQLGLSRDARVVVATAQIEVFVFDGPSGELRTTLDHGDVIRDVAVSPDGAQVVSGGQGGLMIWSVSGELRHRIVRGDDAVLSLAMSADGERVAVGWSDERVRVHELGSGEVHQTIKTRAAPETLALEAGRLAAPTRGGQAKVFEVETGKVVSTLALPVPLGFGHAGNLLLARGLDGESARVVGVIDVINGDVVRPFAGHGGTVTAAAFAPDGNTFASASEDGTVLVWVAP